VTSGAEIESDGIIVLTGNGKIIPVGGPCGSLVEVSAEDTEAGEFDHADKVGYALESLSALSKLNTIQLTSLGL
jgi:hypothetical protein